MSPYFLYILGCVLLAINAYFAVTKGSTVNLFIALGLLYVLWRGL
jgi:hypothetical protein